MAVTTLPSQGYNAGWSVFLREFVTNSGLFWIFDALRVISIGELSLYISLPHIFLLIASLAQTYFLSRPKNQLAWYGNFIAPALYTVPDLLLEQMDFFKEPYHLIFWVYAGLMALVYALYKNLPIVSAIAKGVVQTMLLPALYMVSELGDKVEGRIPLHEYWFHNGGHTFILLSALLFGILLGIATSLRDYSESLLKAVTLYLEQLTNWVFDPALIAKSFGDESQLSLQRVQRTILFMDIRDFTAWSEAHDPAEVVHMLNEYYTLAEQVIEQNNGFKIQLTGDEVMTRFRTVDDGIRAATALPSSINALMSRYQLGAGIGVHTGEVIEGIIGSASTKQYGIIGDSVNTAARLQGVAKAGEVVMSATTYALCKVPLSVQEERAITVKGKSEAIQVYVVRAAALAHPTLENREQKSA